MKVYLVMHEVYMEGCNPTISDIVHKVCATQEVAIDCIKNIEWEDCYTLGSKLWDMNDLEDIFDDDKHERKLCTDSHGYDKFYIVEMEVKES